MKCVWSESEVNSLVSDKDYQELTTKKLDAKIELIESSINEINRQEHQSVTNICSFGRALIDLGHLSKVENIDGFIKHTQGFIKELETLQPLRKKLNRYLFELLIEKEGRKNAK